MAPSSGCPNAHQHRIHPAQYQKPSSIWTQDATLPIPYLHVSHLYTLREDIVVICLICPLVGMPTRRRIFSTTAFNS